MIMIINAGTTREAVTPLLPMLQNHIECPCFASELRSMTTLYPLSGSCNGIRKRPTVGLARVALRRDDVAHLHNAPVQ